MSRQLPKEIKEEILNKMQAAAQVSLSLDEVTCGREIR